MQIYYNLNSINVFIFLAFNGDQLSWWLSFLFATKAPRHKDSPSSFSSLLFLLGAPWCLSVLVAIFILKLSYILSIYSSLILNLRIATTRKNTVMPIMINVSFHIYCHPSPFIIIFFTTIMNHFGGIK